MDYEQLSLLPLMPELLDADDVIEANSQERVSHPVDTIVSIYQIFDRVSNKFYVGISIRPYMRYSSHMSGESETSILSKEMKKRPDDFFFTIVEQFNDANYNPNSPNCRASMIEAFLINYHNAVTEGYNRTLRFHHDYTDEAFWEEVLPPKLLGYYKTANHNLLNERSLKECSRKDYSIPATINPSDLFYKNWAIDYLNEMYSNGIPIYILAKKLNGMSRSSLSRLIKKDNYSAVSSKRIHQVIRAIEEQIGLPKKEYPYFNDKLS